MKAVNLNKKYLPPPYSSSFFVSFFQSSHLFVLEGHKYLGKVTKEMMEPLKIHVSVYETM